MTDTQAPPATPTPAPAKPTAPPAAPREALSILVVDDETIVRESLGAWFRDEGHQVVTAENALEALRIVAERKADQPPFDVAVVDVKMPHMDGLELQARLAVAAPETTVIVMTAYASVQTAVQALKAGAYDYIVKPFDPDELSHLVERVREHRALRRENIRLKESIEHTREPSDIIATSPAMQRVLETVRQVGPSDTTVLILGRSGTGKELVARALHAASSRRYGPLVCVHCGALAEGILESELFGHEKGAFTGAAYHHKGKFEQAHGGTIFLDEIGEVTPKVQVELLRVLEEKKVTRVGGKQPIAVDFRVVAATNRDLEGMVKDGRFREDLYWRLNVVPIRIPPLVERPEDILPLAQHFLERIGRSMNLRGLAFTPEAVEALQAHDWPGNVRELQNAIERAVVLGSPPTIHAHDLPIPSKEDVGTPGKPHPTARSLADLERVHIQAILDETGWNVTQAAAILDVDRGTLYHKIKRYELAKPVPHAS